MDIIDEAYGKNVERRDRELEAALKKKVKAIDDAISETTRLLRNDIQPVMDKDRYRKIHSQLGKVYGAWDKLDDMVNE